MSFCCESWVYGLPAIESYIEQRIPTDERHATQHHRHATDRLAPVGDEVQVAVDAAATLHPSGGDLLEDLDAVLAARVRRERAEHPADLHRRADAPACRRPVADLQRRLGGPVGGRLDTDGRAGADTDGPDRRNGAGEAGWARARGRKLQ